jgi:quinol monooxygenase YgiN
MATLPWTTTESTVEAAGDPERDAVVLGSRLELRSLRHVPGFLGAAMKLRKQVLATPGALGVSLIAQPAHKTFWTLSAWVDQTALDAFVATPAHVAVMRRYHERMNGSAFTTFPVKVGELPEPRSNAKPLWSDAQQRLAASISGSRNG